MKGTIDREKVKARSQLISKHDLLIFFFCCFCFKIIDFLEHSNKKVLKSQKYLKKKKNLHKQVCHTKLALKTTFKHVIENRIRFLGRFPPFVSIPTKHV